MSPLTPFSPDFTVLKAGVFSNGGRLTPVRNLPSLKDVCKSGPVTAWMTHRLSKGETMNEAAGARLGRDIHTLLKNSCVQAVELDIEPLLEAYDWLLKFSKTLKGGLGEISLRFAVPGEFSSESCEKLLEVSDGIDFMLYDTGAKDVKTYVDFLVSILKRADKLAKKFPTKKLVLGIPAYQDKTKRHRTSVENLKSVLMALSQYSPENKVPWCERTSDFSIYAGWTMTSEDKAHSQLIRAWRESLCKNGS